MRGEFICANGMVIPNNITIPGTKEMLQRAIQNISNMSFYVALVSGVFTPNLQVGSLTEPTIGTHGYVRIALARNNTDWPTLGQVNDEWFIESKDLVWAATGGNFNQPITRMAIVPDDTDLTGDVFALSASLPAPLIITPTTLLADRTFRYRIYV